MTMVSVVHFVCCTYRYDFSSNIYYAFGIEQLNTIPFVKIHHRCARQCVYIERCTSHKISPIATLARTNYQHQHEHHTTSTSSTTTNSIFIVSCLPWILWHFLRVTWLLLLRWRNQVQVAVDWQVPASPGALSPHSKPTLGAATSQKTDTKRWQAKMKRPTDDGGRKRG